MAVFDEKFIRNYIEEEDASQILDVIDEDERDIAVAEILLESIDFQDFVSDISIDDLWDDFDDLKAKYLGYISFCRYLSR